MIFRRWATGSSPTSPQAIASSAGVSLGPIDNLADQVGYPVFGDVPADAVVARLTGGP